MASNGPIRVLLCWQALGAAPAALAQSHVAVEALQVHSFPEGHSCATGSRVQLLRKAASGAAIYAPSPSAAVDDVSLVAVDGLGA